MADDAPEQVGSEQEENGALEAEEVVLIDEAGKEHPVLLHFYVGMDGCYFAALSAVDDPSPDTIEIIPMLYEMDGDGTELLIPIKNDDLFTRVKRAIREVFDRDNAEGEEAR